MQRSNETSEASRRRAATLVLGMLGGIASGKSRAARLLAGPEGVVLDADELAHEVLDDPEVSQLVAERFGPELLGADGLPDREALSRRVFDDAAARSELEGWIHPRVRARIMAELEDARSNGVPRVVLDVPLLLENEARHGLTGLCDALVFVEAGEEVRAERAMRTRGWKAGELARREAAQLPLTEKKKRADYVLSNEGGMEELEQAVQEILAQLIAA
ncbi:MAG: dephospho-CoA kinase [Planctomycetota bacterium]|nr:dephospho-CoA kinase [Planctomycetota bacterium]